LLTVAAAAILLASLSGPAWSQDRLTYTNAELDEIMAPIAIYPDPMIAQILPAATYPDQIQDAIRFVRRGGRSRDMDYQPWDVSVRSVAHYPTVLKLLADNPDWTVSVGQAYVDEPDHVFRSIQRLRSRARAYGYLRTNRYQRVYLDSGYVRIVPVQPEYIYVPEYDPQVIYVYRAPSLESNLISFGLGLLIGAWLNRDCDWGHDRVYYHGWNGGGWIGNSRSYVNVTNNYYINNNYRNITINRQIRTRNITNYRNSVRQNAGFFEPPQFRRPTTVRNRNVPSISNQGARPKAGKTMSTSPVRGKTPSFGKPPRSRIPNVPSSVRPGKGSISRTPTGKANKNFGVNSPRSKTPRAGVSARPGKAAVRVHATGGKRTSFGVTTPRRSNAPKAGGYTRPGKGRNTTGGRNNPFGMTSPKSKGRSAPSYGSPGRSQTRSNSKGGQGMGRTRPSGGSSGGRSQPKSGGKGGGRNKGD